MPGKRHFQGGLKALVSTQVLEAKEGRVYFLLAAERKEGQGQEGSTGPCCSQEAGGQEGRQSPL